MNIRRRDDQSVTYLSVHGDLDVLDAIELREAGRKRADVGLLHIAY